MGPAPLKVFSGNANPMLAVSIAKHLGEPLGRITVNRFSDGEIAVRIEESVRGADVFLVQPTCSPVNDNLMELLVMIDACRRASAQRITAVMPYYGYARQDKKIKPEPITARMVSELLTHTGVNRVFAVDLHAEQIQGFFQVPVDHIPAGPIIAEHMLRKGLKDDEVVVVSPDVGGVERATIFAERLGASLAIIAKRRPEPNKAEVMEIIGNVQGKKTIMIDDMIDTAGSITEGAKALAERGAVEIYACCTHAVLSGHAPQKLQDSTILEVVVTDTIPIADEKQIDKLTTLSVAPVLAEAIKRIHHHQSISRLFGEYW